jgi:hypothetical protein
VYFATGHNQLLAVSVDHASQDEQRIEEIVQQKTGMSVLRSVGTDGIALSHGRQPFWLRTGAGHHRYEAGGIYQDGNSMSFLDGACDLSEDSTMEDVVTRIRSCALTEATAERIPISQLLAAMSGKQVNGFKSRPSVCSVVRGRL